MKNKLLPCPFCGKEPEVTKHFKHDMWTLIHRCEAMPTMVIDWTSLDRIEEKWNTRYEN